MMDIDNGVVVVKGIEIPFDFHQIRIVSPRDSILFIYLNKEDIELAPHIAETNVPYAVFSVLYDSKANYPSFVDYMEGSFLFGNRFHLCTKDIDESVIEALRRHPNFVSHTNL